MLSRVARLLEREDESPVLNALWTSITPPPRVWEWIVGVGFAGPEGIPAPASARTDPLTGSSAHAAEVLNQPPIAIKPGSITIDPLDFLPS